MKKKFVILLLFVFFNCFSEEYQLKDIVTDETIRVYIDKSEKKCTMYFPKNKITEISDFSFGEGIERLEINDPEFLNYNLAFLKNFKDLKNFQIWGGSLSSLNFLNYCPKLEVFNGAGITGCFPKNMIIDLSKYINLIYFGLRCWDEENFPVTIQKVSSVDRNLKFLSLKNVRINDLSCFLTLKKEGNKDLKFDFDSDERFTLYGKIPFLEEKDLRAIDGVYHLHEFER